MVCFGISKRIAGGLNRGGDRLNDGRSCPAFDVPNATAGFRLNFDHKSYPAIDAGADASAA
jgi:hypothetical protein